MRYKKQCIIADCRRPYYSLTFCRSHYDKFKRYGQPLRPTEVKRPCHCGEPVVAKNLCRRHYVSQWHHNRFGTVPESELTQATTYVGAHYRLKMVRGLASGYECSLCPAPATQWALSAGVTDLQFGPAAPGRTRQTAYSTNVWHYFPACDSCHRSYDAEHGNRNFKAKAARWEA